MRMPLTLGFLILSAGMAFAQDAPQYQEHVDFECGILWNVPPAVKNDHNPVYKIGIEILIYHGEVIAMNVLQTTTQGKIFQRQDQYPGAKSWVTQEGGPFNWQGSKDHKTMVGQLSQDAGDSQWYYTEGLFDTGSRKLQHFMMSGCHAVEAE